MEPFFHKVVSVVVNSVGCNVRNQEDSNVHTVKVFVSITVVIIKKSLLAPQLSQPSATLMRNLGLPVPPIIFSYDTIAKNNSLYNTLSIFE